MKPEKLISAILASALILLMIPVSPGNSEPQSGTALTPGNAKTQLGSDSIPGTSVPLPSSMHPPVIESRIGYLTAACDIEIPPELPKIFIAPQTTLPVIEDTAENYVVLVNVNSFALTCRIPKYQKFMVMTELSKSGRSLYFRGGIEAETLPFRIYGGEEMPIADEDAANYSVTVVRLKSKLKVKLPKQTQEVVFSKESAFAKFAAEQRRLGLEFYNGVWMPAEKVRELRNSQETAELKKRKLRDTLKAMAEAGVIVLKNGKVVHGSYKGGDKISILFESDNGDSGQYGIDDIADIEIEKALALGNLDSAVKLVSKAREFMGASPGTQNHNPAALVSPGKARRNLEQAQMFLERIPTKFPDVTENSRQTAALISNLNKEIDADLKMRGLALYNYETFPVPVLDYHLKNGHILTVKSKWINPGQLCTRCSGGGEIACRKCQGAGKVNSKCVKCQNGRITCHICDGRGFKSCDVCRGVGEFMRTCPRCGGSGVIDGYYSYPSSPGLYLSSGAVMVPCTPWFYYPTYTTKTCPACGGDGTIGTPCSYCGGSGSLACPKTEKCDFCNGTGFVKAVCEYCDGSGKTICPDCKGKGFNGAAQEYPL